MIEIPSGRPEQTGAQHEAMDRVRELLERDRVGREVAVAQRPWWPRIVGLLLAAVVVGLFTLGLDAFLAVYQRMMNMPADEQPSQAPADAPIAVYVVPQDEPAETPQPEPAETPQPEPSEPAKPSG
jgi:hypothetical protein